VPTGVLAITVWAEMNEPGLRIRVVSNADVVASPERRFTSTQPEEVIAFVRNWLSEFRDAAVTASRRRTAKVVRQEVQETGKYKTRGVE
jgi:hypothetical protein